MAYPLLLPALRINVTQSHSPALARRHPAKCLTLPPSSALHLSRAHLYSALPPSRNDLRGLCGLSRRSSDVSESGANSARVRSKINAVAGPAFRYKGNELILSLAIAVAIPLLAGLTDSIYKSSNTHWFKNLRKPSWCPPDWLFVSAWSALYVVMGVASWLVWVEGGWQLQAYPLTVYLIQLMLNLLWPVIFFGAKEIGLALFDIVALSISVMACIVSFKGVNPLAAYLLYPYLAWLTFATALNYTYWKLNADSGDQFISKPV